ncbi:MAG TPA: PHP domain-containing protein [Steroidobacteraceae bacterium]|jgi:predicted metal-dependent phosphoesterase TrpH|nr:PHP domain-containing protein [Steroidobacteraceae bacterium]
MNGDLTIDLHTHSNCSDGALTPGELVALAAGAGVDVLALTDHDTVAGLEEADRSAGGHSVTLVPGVEISASWRAQAIHVLGLWIDPGSLELRLALDAQGERRRLRMRKMCARLAKLGLPGEKLLAAVEAHPGLPTRAHLANAMVAGGLVNRPDEAFRKYLGTGKAGYFAAEWPALESVVGWIRAAGGVAALAHPARYALSAGARRQLLDSFVAAGGAALEVVSGGNATQHVEGLAALAVKYGLMGSVGSDFHNPQLSWNPLGRSLKLPDCVTPVWRSYITKAATP